MTKKDLVKYLESYPDDTMIFVHECNMGEVNLYPLAFEYQSYNNRLIIYPNYDYDK